MIDSKAIGQRIRQEREILKLSRQEFAELVSLSAYYIGQIERGERQMSLAVLADIANCLHVSADYIIFGTENNYGHIQEGFVTYEADTKGINVKLTELIYLLNRCSIQEQELILKLARTIIPYMSNKPQN